MAGQRPGDQVLPAVSLGASGGYIVWQDNVTDGDGSGVSARRLGANLLGHLGAFRVNEQGAGNQENAKVQLLKNGGAVFVWQSGALGSQDIVARLVGPNGTFATGDVVVNTFSAGQQADPALAVLSNGSVIVVWSSHAQDGSMQGVFGQVLSAAGERIGAEFQLNQVSQYNQRSPAVVALGGGDYIVAWVSEQQRFENSVDIFARRLNTARGFLGGEFLVNGTTNLCANPALSATSKGGFLAGWSQRDIAVTDNAWDVYIRAFNASGAPVSDEAKVNNHAQGNHYAPRIASAGAANLVAWTSVGQDGSMEGVFGRLVDESTAMPEPEFQVNGWAGNRQFQPAVASDGSEQLLTVWSSFVGGSTSFDLFAQRYASRPIKPSAPFVSALSATRLSVTWPQAGNNTVASYELYVDNSAEPQIVTGNSTTINSLAPNSTHSFKLAYKFVNGGKSALSDAATGRTWGGDENLDGLPDDWQTGHWGGDSAKWPDPKADTDGDGATNLQEFQAGTNPLDRTSVLRVQINATAQGSFLAWNTQPGFIYQVQTSTDLTGDWTDSGARLAAGSTDSVLLEAGNEATYYRVKRVR